MESRLIEGQYKPAMGTVAIVASRFNSFVVDTLVSGAQHMLLRYGMKASQIHIVRVPGAYELPLICQQVAKTGRYQGIIALGAVIRGSTPHFDYVAGACTQGLMQAGLAAQIPIIFGVITTETVEQAIDRSGARVGNKGEAAAMELLEMLNVLEQIHG